MAGKFSDYLNNALLSHVFGSTPYTKPANLYVGLMTTRGSGSSSGTEIVGNGYARQSIVFAQDEEPLGSIDNASAVAFPPASGGPWGTITDFAVFDAITGGNMLVYGTLVEAKLIKTGDRIEFLAGALVITLA